MAASATTEGASRRWLFGPLPDLLLGCGVFYLCVMALYAFRGAEIRSAQPLFLMGLLVVVISMPHYGATLLRVYERSLERRRYAVFAVHSTVVVVLLTIAAFYNAWWAAILVTLYLTWSPWHYSGQNFGIAMLFLRRRGVPVSQTARRLLQGSFTLSFLTSICVLHRGRGGSYSFGEAADAGQLFVPIGLPQAVVDVAVPVLILGCVGCLIAASWLLARAGRARDLLPAWMLAVTQAMWFTVPASMVLRAAPTGIEPFDARRSGIFDYQVWLWVGHALQYLWVTAYYVRAEEGFTGFGRYYGKIAMVGTAVWTLPVILFAPDGLGTYSYSAGLALVVAAGINVHHFLLDGAIWKLRNSRVAAILLRDGVQEPTPPPGIAPVRWPRRLVWSVAAIGAICTAFVFSQQVVLLDAQQRGELGRAAAALDRLAWFGRDDETRRVAVGDLAARRRNFDEARRQYQRSLALRPDAGSYLRLARLEMRSRGPEHAAPIFEAALWLAPQHPDALLGAGRTLLRLGRAAEAIPLLESAAELRPEHEPTQRSLRAARAQTVSPRRLSAAAAPHQR